MTQLMPRSAVALAAALFIAATVVPVSMGSTTHQISLVTPAMA